GVLVVRHSLCGGRDQHWLMRRVRGSFDAAHDERDAAVALLAAVEKVERLDDPRRRLMFLQRDRTLVEPGRGVRSRVLAIDNADTAEILACRPILMHVALSEHGDLTRRRQQ